ncbi:MAG: hypothetical protein U0Q20_09420 [Mycobacterium sp.]|nr:hypothetical protein [Mycobacterium sp.]
MSAMHPVGRGHAPQWYTSSPTCNKAYAIALVRAGIIAALLIGVLALIVLT